jgi:prevent-host-death family protein
MVKFTTAEAHSRFGELIDRAQREPVAVTRRGRTVAYVVAPQHMADDASLAQQCADAARWFAAFRDTARDAAYPAAASLTDAEVDALARNA